MFELKNFSKKSGSVGVFDCRTGEVGRLPLCCFVDANLNECRASEAVAELRESDAVRGAAVAIPTGSESARVRVNSVSFTSPVELGEIATFGVGENLFYIASSARRVADFAKIDVSKWLLFYAETGMIEDEMPFERLKDGVLSRGLSGEGMAVCPSNFDVGFMFGSVFADGADASGMGGGVRAAPALAESVVAATCPLCWLKFDVGDALSIAAHESLRGDPVLGEDEMLRFLPTSFNEDGVALDPMGTPSPDVACPHCRKKLPPNYFDYEQKIFSIVGAPSSGKSYYLSVLVGELQASLFRNFAVVMKDLDPTGNMLLTQMKNRLYSAKRPEDAILAKTALEGAMYERYPRFGKMVSLPKPMTYALSKDGGRKTSLVFYDNAGEHFEPGLDLEQSPGALHVASGAAIFFLFDPAASREFKARLGDHPDPQLAISGRLDQQDTILAEMDVRIKRIRALGSDRKIDTPLAVLVGKYDIWRHLLDAQLPQAVCDGMLDLEAIGKASGILRGFLMSVVPNIVAQVESISSNVRYFAVSALGHSPQMIESGFCAGKIAPVPGKLNPINVEIPALWAISQTTNLIPTGK